VKKSKRPMALLARMLFCCCVPMLTVTLFMTSPQAFAATPSTVCHVLLVHLHGKTSTTKCLLTETQYQAKVQAEKSNRSGVAPKIGGDSCAIPVAIELGVSLFRDGNFSGPCIAFSGSGEAELYNYTLSGTTTWNDQASSFISGCVEGVFGEDSDLTVDGLYGHAAYFGEYVSRNFPYSGSNGTINGTVRNDTLTSVLLNNSPCI
jgi:hypothetical protein